MMKFNSGPSFLPLAFEGFLSCNAQQLGQLHLSNQFFEISTVNKESVFFWGLGAALFGRKKILRRFSSLQSCPVEITNDFFFY